MDVASRVIRPRFRRPALFSGLLVAILAALACGVGPLVDPYAERRDVGAPAEPVAPVTEPPEDGTDTVEEFERDIESAVRLAEVFWAERFERMGRRFQPVAAVIPYTRDGEVRCGTQALSRNNAAYCGSRDIIAYDVRWAFAAFRQVGDAFVFYLIGHEYAHAVQARLRIRHDFTIQQELQADCFAGAYLGDSVREGLLILDTGDLPEFRRGLIAVADDPDQPWFAEDAHGTAEQRTEAFFAGFERSLDACEF